MKLVIQIPCLNEEKTLPETIRDLPRSVAGIDTIEILVVDDGSTDRTAEAARQYGAHHVLRLGTNRGLARAFAAGLNQALTLGADIIVNTDADNQYCGADIPKLVQPILRGEADLVVGCRPIVHHPEFSPLKKVLQRAGSWTLRLISKTTVRDAPSGFRAFSRETAQRLFLYSGFSHCMETLIQAGNSGLRVASVDVGVNRKTRESRLYKSLPQYLWKSGSTMVAMFVLYRPAAFFAVRSTLPLLAAVALGLRFLFLVFITRHPDVHRTYLPSLILLLLLAMTGVLLLVFGVVAELIRTQRRLTEEVLYLRRKETQSGGRNPP
jgi:glycosyltransferase involved in cell wall biosynthesis